jgi:hypothetical protein
MRQTRFRSAVSSEDQVTYQRLMVRLTLVYGSLAFGMMLFALLHQKPQSVQTEGRASANEFSAVAIPRDHTIIDHDRKWP